MEEDGRRWDLMKWDFWELAEDQVVTSGDKQLNCQHLRCPMGVAAQSWPDQGPSTSSCGQIRVLLCHLVMSGNSWSRKMGLDEVGFLGIDQALWQVVINSWTISTSGVPCGSLHRHGQIRVLAPAVVVNTGFTGIQIPLCGLRKTVQYCWWHFYRNTKPSLAWKVGTTLSFE